jgi:hypothetical protein
MGRHNKVICKFTLSLGPASPHNPSFSGIHKVRRFYYCTSQYEMLKLSTKCWVWTFNARGSRGYIVDVQVVDIVGLLGFLDPPLCLPTSGWDLKFERPYIFETSYTKAPFTLGVRAEKTWGQLWALLSGPKLLINARTLTSDFTEFWINSLIIMNTT